MVVCILRFPDSRVLARRETSIAIVVYGLEHLEGELGSVSMQKRL